MSKRTMDIVYSSRKWSSKVTTHTSEEENPQEMGGSTVEAKKVSTRVLLGHLTAVTEGQDQEPTVLHPRVKGGTEVTTAPSMWRSEEEEVGNTEQANLTDSVQQSVIPHEVPHTSTSPSNMHEAVAYPQTGDAGVASSDDKVVQGGDDRMSALLIIEETSGEPTIVGDNPPTTATEEPPMPQGADDRMSALRVAVKIGGEPTMVWDSPLTIVARKPQSLRHGSPIPFDLALYAHINLTAIM
ncbi:hypothetical protein Cgig2_013870 [Carnegiea gigantea]|uniref:Uncharacterized protein n=1 Tax=Carnegiea gigantea TaxID=171969 RepID=A0A9Q1KKQ6_9CARY|nr:hypothetical protein Cgig2_013870 [Carnegiea gigantea]